MVGKNNKYLKTTKEGTKVESYSIKKFKVGTASVVIDQKTQKIEDEISLIPRFMNSHKVTLL